MPFPVSLLTPPAGVTFERQFTAEQETDVAALAAHYNADGYTLDGDALTEREQMHLSKETLLRFRLSSRDVAHTIERIDANTRFRREHKVEDWEAMAAAVKPEMKTGKVFILGFSKAGQPVMYVFHPRNDWPSAQRTQIPAIFFLERARDLQAGGVDSIYVFQNYGVPKLGDNQTPAFAKENMQIVADHYPRNVGKAVLQDMGFVVRTFINLIWPFVDSWTKEVTLFDKSSKPQPDIEASLIPKECKGEFDYTWNVDEYWPVLMAVIKARRTDQEKRFREVGAKVGVQEKLFKVTDVAVTL